MKLKQLFISLFIINTFVLGMVVFIISDYLDATKVLENAYKKQYQSFLLADELRQSSDDLTRVARTYVITGNSMFKEQFKTILDIRNGIQARPKYYNGIYWDLLTLNNSKAILDGDKIPLRTLMKEAGFQDNELLLLYESQKESDKLTYLETKAMNAIKGIFQDKDGNYTIKAKADFKLAREIMHSDEYHKAKISIMKPLDKFYKAFEKRTQFKVNEAHDKVKQHEKYVSGSVFFLIVLVLFSFFTIMVRIIYPLEALKNTMLGLSKNDMDTQIPYHRNDDEVGEMIGTVEVFKDNAVKLMQKEEKLKKAINEANSANHAKSVFLANMSHELRTPLNAILGFAKLLEKSVNINLKEKENATTIKNSGNHLLTIINEILEFSKIEAGKIKIVKEDFNLFDMVKEISSMFDTRFKNKNLEFTINIDNDVPKYINTDELRLRQIIINLLGNALKFTQNGSVTLNIKVNKDRLYFNIIDTGIGMNNVALKNIFNPFEQIETKKYTKQGTGLGLSITKELVSLMGGKIDVKSEPNAGSNFSFTIKFSIVKDEDIQDETNDLLIQKVQYTNKSILVVDDIEENRNLLVQLLQQYSINTLEAKDGNEVIDILDNNTIDLVFMDISMPILDGFETTKLIRSDKSKDNIPVIIVSANVFQEDMDNTLEVGANGFLEKPIDETKLIKHLNTFLLDTEILDKNIAHEVIEYAQKLDSKAIYKTLENKSIPSDIAIKINDLIKQFDFNGVIKLCESYS